MLEASKLCKPGPQASIFQHLHESEASPEGGYRKCQCLFKGLLCWTTSQKFMVEASKLCMLGPQDSIFQHFFEPEVGPEGGVRKCQ